MFGRKGAGHPDKANAMIRQACVGGGVQAAAAPTLVKTLRAGPRGALCIRSVALCRSLASLPSGGCVETLIFWLLSGHELGHPSS